MTKAQRIIDKVSLLSFLAFVFSLCTMKPSVGLLGFEAAPSDLLFVIVVLLWLVSLLTRSAKIRLSQFMLPVLAYVLGLTISAIFSEDFSRSVSKLIGVCYLGAIALITYQIVSNRNRFRWTLVSFLAGAAIPVAIGIAALLGFYLVPSSAWLEPFIYHYGAVPVGNYPRLCSTFVSASMFFNYLSLASVALIVARESLGLSTRIFLLAAGPLLICSLFTISIGLGSLFVILGLFLWTQLPARRASVRRISLSTGLIAAFGFLLISPISLISNSSDAVPLAKIDSFSLYPSSRLTVWEKSITAIENHPVLGVGIGLPSVRVFVPNADGSQSFLTDSHNTFLNITAQAGIVGLVALLALCIYITRLAFGSCAGGEVTKGSATWWLGVAFVTAFIYQGITGSFEDARHLWLLIGLIPSLCSMRSIDESVAP